MAKTPRRRPDVHRSVSEDRGSKLCVLVVDDFPDGLEMVSEYLAFRGFSVHVARSGTQAIEVAQAVTPDVVLMDLVMPDLDGRVATHILKSDPRTSGVCVIAVTAQALNVEVESAMNAGCDGVISKPFDLLALANALPHVRTNCLKALNVPGLALPWTPQQSRARMSRGSHHAE
jgi:two-component system cell cycle response regulator DivK